MLGLPKLVQSGRMHQIVEHGPDILNKTGARYVAVTMDRDGVILLERGSEPYKISCVPQNDARTIGAGDTFTSALALAYCSGKDPKSAVRIASIAASIVIQKKGTGKCTG